jgi:inorganic pyrophosphatase
MSDSRAEIGKLPAFDGNSDTVNVVLEVSKGSRTKLKYEQRHGVFRSEKVLPVGLVFPFDFGFIPSTLADDGDPLDAIVLSEAGLPAQTVVYAKLLTIIKCKQTEKRRAERNDRIVALPLDAKSRKPMQPSVRFDSSLEEAIARFFVEYNKLQGKTFRVIGTEGPRSALAAIRKSVQRAGSEK